MLENPSSPQCVHILIARTSSFSAGFIRSPPTMIGGVTRTQFRKLRVQGWGALEILLREVGRKDKDGNLNWQTCLLTLIIRGISPLRWTIPFSKGVLDTKCNTEQHCYTQTDTDISSPKPIPSHTHRFLHILQMHKYTCAYTVYTHIYKISM